MSLKTWVWATSQRTIATVWLLMTVPWLGSSSYPHWSCCECSGFGCRCSASSWVKAKSQQSKWWDLISFQILIHLILTLSANENRFVSSILSKRSSLRGHQTNGKRTETQGGTVYWIFHLASDLQHRWTNLHEKASRWDSLKHAQSSPVVWRTGENEPKAITDNSLSNLLTCLDRQQRQTQERWKCEEFP